MLTLNQNLSSVRAPRQLARFMFSSTIEIGRTKLRSKEFIMLAIMLVKMVSAAFSKSVNYMSMGLNSTRHPMLESSVGGGFRRRLFQLVEAKFW